MYKIQSMNNDKSMRTLVFFSDFAADMGLKSILQNGLPVEPERFGQAYFENEIGYPRDADMDFSIPKSERYVMPLYDIINYLLRLDSIQPKNKLIVFTENNDHIMLKLLASSITGHPFSFSSSAEVQDGRVEMSIRNLGDFTSSISKLQVGQRVYLDGPYGAFTLGQQSDMRVLIAGGVGITPMISMIRTLADRGDRQPVILIYGSKDWESITFREELEVLKTRVNLTVVHVLTQPPEDWSGERGFINADLFKRHLPPVYADHEYFICGPNVMMDAIEKTLSELDVPMSQYHSERYNFA